MLVDADIVLVCADARRALGAQGLEEWRAAALDCGPSHVTPVRPGRP